MASIGQSSRVFGSFAGPLTEAKSLADGLPSLLIEARRVSSTVLSGWHGRRRAGSGETFWQFRPFVPGETTSGIDWRRSARDEHLFIREKEWEAAHTLWLWADLTPSMVFRSRAAPATKRDRAVVILLALADLLAAAGERVGIPGAGDPILARNAAERLARSLTRIDPERGQPVTAPIRRFSDVVLIGDFLDPMAELEVTLDGIASVGARGHLIQTLDPVEETFPFAGRTEFLDPESGARHLAGRAESYREAYRQRLTERRERLSSFCRKLGWSFLVHHTDRPASEPVLSLHARLADRQESAGSYVSGGRAA